MKKIIAMILIVLLTVTAAGCKKEENKDTIVEKPPIEDVNPEEPEKQPDQPEPPVTDDNQTVESNVTGIVEDATMNTISIRTEKDELLLFSKEDAELINVDSLVIGDTFKIYYTGTMEGTDTSKTKVTKLEKLESVKYTGLSKEDAQALVTERIDTAVYKIELSDSELKAEDKLYFIFSISDKEGKLPQSVAVEKESGELYCYDSDKVIKSYSKFKLYDETKDAECDWNGTFIRKSAGGTASSEIELAQGDISSFEFSIATGSKKSKGKLEFGTARISGNTAVFEDDKGFKINFTMKDKTLVVKETGKNSYVTGKATFEGEYELSK